VKIIKIIPILVSLTFGFNAKSQKKNFLKMQEVYFEEVLKIAKKENKIVFMHICVVWCGHCKVMDKTTF
jgi:Tat protein secretion system quality control protein TatD with DNase activity